MDTNKSKIVSFTDLNVWRKGHELAIEVYKISKDFPKDELFGLTSQIRRAVVSITSCIAEGFSRHSLKEKLQYYYMALGSLTEVQNQLLLSYDLGFISKENFDLLADIAIVVSKLLNGIIKSSKYKIQNS